MFLGLPIGVYVIVFIVLGVLSIIILSMRKGSGSSNTAQISQLGPYKNLTLLTDKGGMAKVYHAFNSEAGRECVLKVLRSDMLGDAEIVKKFHREGDILKTIKQAHPEAPIVQVYTTGTISTQLVELPFIEMEYIPGKTDLSDYLKQHGKQNQDTAEKVIAQIVRALTAAHEQGAVHRDLKPGNVLLHNGDPEKVVVCDFGVAKQLDSKSVTLGGYGTAAYMSPEQCGGKGKITPKTDIYALGVMWYEMLTGKHLFDDDNPMVLMRKHEQDDPASLLKENIPEKYQTVLQNMLRKNSSERPELREVLESVSGTSLQTPGYRGTEVESVTRKYGAPGSGSKRLVWGLTLLLVFLVSALGYELYRSNTLQIKNNLLALVTEPTPTYTPTVIPTVTPLPSTAIPTLMPTNTPVPPTPTPSPISPSPTPVRKANLTVKAEPADALVRIMNITGRYEDGIELNEGRYRINVSKEGYKMQEEWIEQRAGEDKVLHPVLVLVQPTATPVPPTPMRVPPTPTPKGPQAGQPLTVTLPGGVKMELVWIVPGEFMMGSPSGEKGRDDDDEGPPHRVRLTKGFWMGQYEVTNRQYRSFRSGHNSKDYKGESLNGNNQPTVYVSWNDAKAFCVWAIENQNGLECRLPTEAEWEYACRAGTTTRRYWGDDEGENQSCRYANVANPSVKQQFGWSWDVFDCEDQYKVTSPVGSFQPNTYGLYDTLGNVWEWCGDRYGEYPGGTQTNPKGAVSGSYRVKRGGGWLNDPRGVRSATRSRATPGNTDDGLGFRIVIVRT